MNHTSSIPLPDKKVSELTPRQMQTFRRWIGFDGGTKAVPYPTPAEKQLRQRRERWKRRYAGKGAEEPRLLVRAEHIERVQKNASRHSIARRWVEDIIRRANLVAGQDQSFWNGFIDELACNSICLARTR